MDLKLTSFSISVGCLASLMGCRQSAQQPTVPLRNLSQPLPQQADERQIKIKARVDKAVYKPGENIVVHLDMHFNGSVLYLQKPSDYFHCFYPEVILPSGQIAVLSEPGARFFDDHVGGSIQVGRAAPHFADAYDFPLSRLYDLSTEGQYKVRFERSATNAPEDQDSQGTRMPKPDFAGLVFSNEVVFSVKK